MVPGVSHPRRAWGSASLLASGPLLILSLYLPWVRTDCPSGGSQECRSLDGWGSSAAWPLALFALLLAALAAADLSSRRRPAWLSAGLCAACSAYFAIAVGVTLRGDEGTRGADGHWAYGALVALAALVCLAVAAWQARDRRLPATDGLAVRLGGMLLASALLVSFLFPWLSFLGWYAGISLPPAVVASVLAVWLAGVWWRGGPWQERLGLSAASLLFTGATFAAVPGGIRAWGAWTGLGLAVTLFALAAVLSPRPSPPPRSPWRELVAAAAAALFVASLFLPWAGNCGASLVGCLTSGVWIATAAPAAAVLALALTAALLVPRLLPVGPGPLAAAFALLVATLAFGTGSGRGYSFDYGAWIGLAAAAALVATAVARVRPRPPARPRESATPIAACLTYLLVVLLPNWYVLPFDVQSKLAFEGLTWPAVAGVLLCLCLIAEWDSSLPSDRLVVLPLAMLAPAALIVFEIRLQGLYWGEGLVVGLCLGLAAAGWIRVHGVPRVLRIDRIELPDP